MAKKNKKVITLPVLITLAVVLCLVLVFSNFTSVSGFMSSVAGSASDLFAAAAKKPNTSPTIKIADVGNWENRTAIIHPGDPIRVTWSTENIDTSTSTIEKIIFRTSEDGALQAVGKAINDFRNALLPKRINKGIDVVGGAITDATREAPKPSDFELSLNQGSGEYGLMIPKLSNVPGKVITKTPGKISKKVFVVAEVYHMDADKNENKIVARAKYPDVYISNTLDLRLRRTESLTPLEPMTVVHPGDNLKIVFDKKGDFSDFTDKIDFFIGTKSDDHFRINLEGDSTDHETSWIVPDFDDFPGKVDTKTVPGKVIKSFVIKGSMSYIGGTEKNPAKAPVLTAFSEAFLVEDSAPTVTFSASATSTLSGDPVTLTWNSTKTYSCDDSPLKSWFTKEQQNVNATNTSGSTVVKPTKTTTYTLSCAGKDSLKHNIKVEVEVLPAPSSVVAIATGNRINKSEWRCAFLEFWSNGDIISPYSGVIPCSGTDAQPPNTIKIIKGGFTISLKFPSGSTKTYNKVGTYDMIWGYKSITVKAN